jgi:hypothetical protein
MVLYAAGFLLAFVIMGLAALLCVDRGNDKAIARRASGRFL